MYKVVRQGQSLFDFAMEHCGTFEAAFEIAQLNGDISVTDYPVPGTLLKLLENITKKDISDYIATNNIRIATSGFNTEDIEIPIMIF